MKIWIALCDWLIAVSGIATGCGLGYIFTRHLMKRDTTDRGEPICGTGKESKGKAKVHAKYDDMLELCQGGA